MGLNAWEAVVDQFVGQIAVEVEIGLNWPDFKDWNTVTIEPDQTGRAGPENVETEIDIG